MLADEIRKALDNVEIIRSTHDRRLQQLADQISNTLTRCLRDAENTLDGEDLPTYRLEA